MQALSMIDTGKSTLDTVAPVQSTEPKGKPFRTVMQEQEQGQTEAARDLNASQAPEESVPTQQKNVENSDVADGKESQTILFQDSDVVDQETVVATVDEEHLMQVQSELQQTLVALMKVVAGHEESDADAKDLLNQLVVQLEESDLSGEQILAGVDLSALVEQIQQVVVDGDDGEVSLEALADQLACQLEQQQLTKEEVPVGLTVAVDDGLTVSKEVSSKVGAMAQARDILQRAINAVQSQQTNVEEATEGVTSKTLTEEVVVADEMTEGVDPRFAQLLEPRTQKAQQHRVQAQQSLRQQAEETSSVKRDTPLTVSASEMSDTEGLAGQVDLSSVKESLEGNSLPKGIERLAQVVQGSTQGIVTAGQNGAAKVMPQTPMVQLPSGHQVAESQIFDQVVTHISGSRNGESGRMILRLQPAELGSLKLDLMVEGDRVKANLHAQTLQVQEVLERNLPQLRNALAEQGLKIDQFQVGLDQRQQSGEFDQMAQENNRNEFQQAGNDDQPARDQEEHEIPLAHLIQNGGGGISLHV